MTVKHCELFGRTGAQVLPKPTAVLVQQRVENPVRQDKIVNPAAVLRQLVLNRIVRMHLGQQFDIKGIGQLLDPVQKAINLRLDEKAAGAQLFDHIANRIQPDDLDIVLLEAGEEFDEQLLDLL
ncbi:hypothetical protein D3C87_1797710 [compost metagenome]